MHWKDIKVSQNNTYFTYKEEILFGLTFLEVLKFHAPGLAPVTDDSGSYHITTAGLSLYSERYQRTFGYYGNRAAVIEGTQWYHLDETGKRAYKQSYVWTGNYQENLCTVRDEHNQYFHINPDGNRVYKEGYHYAGDFKDGFACVKTTEGNYRHIDTYGEFLNKHKFHDLGVFHKNFATAKDLNGWFHIDKTGLPLYSQRYTQVEPFYNGFALVSCFEGGKQIISESGEVIVKI